MATFTTYMKMVVFLIIWTSTTVSHLYVGEDIKMYSCCVIKLTTRLLLLLDPHLHLLPTTS